MYENDIGTAIVGRAVNLHQDLGPGLPEDERWQHPFVSLCLRLMRRSFSHGGTKTRRGAAIFHPPAALDQGPDAG